MGETCETCRFFQIQPNDRLGSCSRWLMGYGIRDSDIGDNEVLVEDDEGWGMSMGRKFGCVLHESLPQPTETAI